MGLAYAVTLAIELIIIAYVLSAATIVNFRKYSSKFKWAKEYYIRNGMLLFIIYIITLGTILYTASNIRQLMYCKMNFGIKSINIMVIIFMIGTISKTFTVILKSDFPNLIISKNHTVKKYDEGTWQSILIMLLPFAGLWFCFERSYYSPLEISIIVYTMIVLEFIAGSFEVIISTKYMSYCHKYLEKNS